MNARPTILALATALAWSAGPSAQAQQPPSPQVLAMSSLEDAASRQAIKEFVDPNLKMIASGAPQKVEEARKSLALVLRKPDGTLVFHQAFLELSKPTLDQIVKSGDGYRITNALLVVRQIRCPNAVKWVLEQSSPKNQPDLRIRIAANGMIAAMVRGGAVTSTEYDGLARDVRTILEAESDPLAASQLMEAIGAIGVSAQGANLPLQVSGAIEEILKASNSAIDRAAKPDTADFAIVVYRGVISLRDLLVNMPGDQRSAVARSLAPVFARIRELPAGAAGSNAAREVKAAKDSLPGLEAMVGLAKPEPAKK